MAVNVNDTIGFEADYFYHRLSGPSRTCPSPLLGGSPVLIESNQQLNVGSFNLVMRTPSNAPVAGYVLGGPGIYHRTVQLTTPSVGVATVCDPYWLVCYPTAMRAYSRSLIVKGRDRQRSPSCPTHLEAGDRWHPLNRRPRRQPRRQSWR